MGGERHRSQRVGLAVLWVVGTAGRSAVFSAGGAAVAAYDSWLAVTYPDDGASMLFVLVWPVQFVVAVLWAAVDSWRGASWVSLTARWGIATLVAGVAVTATDVRTAAGSYTWADLPSGLLGQLLPIAVGVWAGATLSKDTFRSSRRQPADARPGEGPRPSPQSSR